MMNIYDFDGTIYNGDSTFDFMRYCLIKKPSLVRFFPGYGVALLRYVTKKIDKTAFKEQLYRLFTGCDVASMLDDFWDLHQGKIFPWYLSQQEQDDIIISASPEFLLKPICERLGIQHLIASRVDCQTGKYTGQNCWGPEKCIRLKNELGITRCRNFFSDAKSDQPLADIADHAFLIKKGTVLPWNE